VAAPDSDSINVGVNSSTRIQTRRTSVKGRRPSVDDLLQGELAYNYFDGTLSVKQDTAGVGVGTRIININNVPPGNTWFVATNGDDLNQGDSPDFPFLTIKKAAGIATPGDVIKIDGGTYIEDNPIVMQDFVTLAGADLRNTLLQPQNTTEDLIWLGGGGTVQDLSFVGTVSNDAAVIAFRPLLGVSSDRFFDAARLIRQNLKYLRTEAVGFLTSGLSGFAGGNRAQDAARLLDQNIDFIAEEAVGYLTSTDYLDPPFVISDSGGAPLSADNCSDDIKDLIRAISNDLKSNSNKKSIGAAQSYFTGGVLDHVDGVDSNGYSIADATIEAIERAVAISTDVINNRPYSSGLLVGNALNINSFDYTESTGVATVTTGVAHSLVANDIVNLVGLAFTCSPYNNTVDIYDFQYDNVSGVSTVITKTAHGITTGQAVSFDGIEFSCTKSYDSLLGITAADYDNVSGVMTVTTSGDHLLAAGMAIKFHDIKMECSKGFDTIFGISTASYDNVSGILTVTTDAPHLLNRGMSLRLSDLEFSCAVEHAGVTTTIFPDGTNGRIFNTVITAVGSTTFTTQVGTSTIPHVYEGSGSVETGITTDVFPSTQGIEYGISDFVYTESTGVSTITLNKNHNILAGADVKLADIEFTCGVEHAGVTTTIFPDGTQGDTFRVVSVGSSTLVINAGISTIAHTYASHGILSEVQYADQYKVQKVNSGNQFEANVGAVGFAHTYVSGGTVQTGITTNIFPSRLGIEFAIQDFEYDKSTGLSTVTLKKDHNITAGETVNLTGVAFTCLPYNNEILIYDFQYDAATGVSTILTVENHGLIDGDLVELRDIEFTCSVEHAGVTTTFFPDGTQGFIYNVLAGSAGTTLVTNVGISTIAHTYDQGGKIKIGITTTVFPDGTQGSEFEVISVGSSTLTINAGISTIDHVYDSGGFLYGVKYIGNYTVSSVGTSTDFTIPIETVGFAHTYVSGGIVRVSGVTTNVFPVEDLNLSPRGLNFVVDSVVGLTTYVTNVGISSIIHNYIPDTGSSQKVKKYTTLGQSISPSVLRVSEGCVAVGATIENLAGIVTNSIGTGVSYLTGITTVFGVDIDDIDKCALDVGTILLSVAHDITRGGNSKCIGAAKSYFNDDGSLIDTFLRRNEEIEQTIATLNHVFKPVRSVINNVGAGQFPIGTNVNVIAAEYDNDIGIVTITTNESHNLSIDDPVELVGLGFTCLYDGGVTEVVFPSARLGQIYDVYKVIDSTRFESVVGISTINHIYTSGGTVQRFGNFQEEFTQLRDLSMQGDPVFGWNRDLQGCANVVSAIRSCIGIVTGILQNYLDNVGLGTTAPEPWAGFTTTYPGNAGAGQTDPDAIPSQGVGIIRKGPYIINCTNFIKNSIGARIDGFAADEGDQENDLGIQGSFNVDSYTQFNQGGIGVSVSNGAYCQLVSIFTICCDTAISAVKGGQLDLTNSNSSFGTRGLIAIGVGDNTTSSADRYTARVVNTSTRGSSTIQVSGVGTFKPYGGQALYFDELYTTIEDILVTDGGSGYTLPPKVNIEFPTGPGNAINAQATSSIDADGKVTTVNLLSQGLQYQYAPSITFTNQPGDTTGVGAAATALMTPVYYGVDSATTPYAGISTVTLVQTLNNDVGVGSTAYFSRQSLQIASSHSFEFIGAGNTIEFAYPSRGGVSRQEDEVIKVDGGEVIYTSTDERGNFRIGDGVVINQTTGTVSGRDYSKSLFVQVTPFILALGGE
jgi:hypothetical protein